MNTNDIIAPMLDGLTVLELDSGGLAEFAGKLLADSGADVIKIEPPAGAASRRVGPFVGEDAGPDASLQFEHYNTSKRSVVLDLDIEADRSALKALAAQADVVLDGLGAGVADRLGIGWQTLHATNPGLIYCSVTPFGVDGPWSNYAASDLTQLALGGVMASCGYDDLPDDDPVAPIGGHAKQLVGTMAALAAAFEKEVSGNGQFIDVSAHESIATSTEMAVPFWIYQQRDVERHSARHAMPADTPRGGSTCAPTASTSWRCRSTSTTPVSPHSSSGSIRREWRRTSRTRNTARPAAAS